jgi:hypothetical protein
VNAEELGHVARGEAGAEQRAGRGRGHDGEPSAPCSICDRASRRVARSVSA